MIARIQALATCCILTIVAGLLPAIGTSGAVVFQADFSGAGGGTGGPNDIVNLGGTGWLPSGMPGLTNSIIAAVPFATNSGNYLETVCSSGNYGSNTLPYVTFNFTSPTNSFLVFQSPNVTFGASNYVALSGAFDIFFRPNAFAPGDSGWFCPVDGDPSIGGGGKGLQLTFSGNGNGCLMLQLNSVNGAAFTDFTATGASYGANNQIWISGGNLTTAGQLYHAGFTFNTDNTARITMKMFLQKGMGAIITTNGIFLNSAVFRLNADIVSNAFAMAPWSFTGGQASHGAAVSVDFGAVRLYDSDPGVFTALPSQSLDPTPSLTACAKPAGAPFQFLLQGAPNRTYDIQAASNPGNWSFLGSITLLNSSAYFTDGPATNLPSRFYRAVLEP